MELLFSNLSNIGNAIGWTLIHFLWQGALLFLGYWSITRLFLKNKINLQYWIGIFFISLCLIVPIREFFVQLGTSVNHFTLLDQASSSFSEIRSAGILNPTDLFISLIQKIIPFLVVIWAISVFLIGTHLFKSWLILVRISKEPSADIPDYLIAKLEQAIKVLKLRFKPAISISKKIDIPATFGYFKPIVLIPISLINKMPQEQMEAILLHELCHIKRADFLHNIIQLLVETLFFYHPLTKWISRDIRKIREQCCDDLVLELKTNPLTYAKALTNIATIYNSNEAAKLNIQIAASDGELFNRIKFLMLNKRPKSSLTNIFIGIFFSALALFIFNKIINNNNNDLAFQNNATSETATVLENTRPDYTAPNIYDFLTKPQTTTSTKETSSTPQTRVLRNKTSNEVVLPTKQTKKNTNTEELKRNSTLPLDSTTELTNISNEDIFANDSSIVTMDTKLINSTDLTANTSTSTVDMIEGSKLINNSTETTPQEDIKNYPKVIKRVNPKLGIYERLSGAEGTVILSFNIDRNGKVKKISIDKKSKLKILDSISRQALRRWQFDPKSINPSNINERYQQIFRFSLEDKMLQCSGSVTGSRINRKQLCNNNLDSA